MRASRNYPLLLVSQFLGAFGDNAVLAVLVGRLTWLRQNGRMGEEAFRSESALLAGVLFIPFIALAPLAGWLNDRHPKTTWLAGGNAIKILGTALCAAGAHLGFWAQAAGYLVVGIGSAFYGPAKYGVLPEIVERRRLVRANASVELLTLVAILTGVVAGAALADRWPDRAGLSLALVAAVYGLSLALNLAMGPTPGNPGVRFAGALGEFSRDALHLCRSPRLGRILVGTCLFWLCGASMKINFQAWGLARLHLTSNTEISLMGLWLSVGVMAGSIVAGRLFPVSDLRSTRRSAWLLAAFLALLTQVDDGWMTPAAVVGGMRISLPVALSLVASGIAAGLFLIPLNAALQAESDPNRLGKTIAVQNLTDNIGMLTASGVCTAAPAMGVSPSAVFAILAAAVVATSFALNFPPASHQPVAL